MLISETLRFPEGFWANFLKVYTRKQELPHIFSDSLIKVVIRESGLHFILNVPAHVIAYSPQHLPGVRPHKIV